jgi:hypothetical protein
MAWPFLCAQWSQVAMASSTLASASALVARSEVEGAADRVHLLDAPVARIGTHPLE